MLKKSAKKDAKTGATPDAAKKRRALRIIGGVAGVVELVARMDWRTRVMTAPGESPARPDDFLIDKHFLRKHGPGATYGQR